MDTCHVIVVLVFVVALRELHIFIHRAIGPLIEAVVDLLAGQNSENLELQGNEK